MNYFYTFTYFILIFIDCFTYINNDSNNDCIVDLLSMICIAHDNITIYIH